MIVDPPLLDRMVKLARQRNSLTSIGRILGLDRNVVKYNLRKTPGWPYYLRVYEMTVDKDKKGEWIRKLREDGASWDDIVSETGIKSKSLLRYWRDHKS